MNTHKIGLVILPVLAIMLLAGCGGHSSQTDEYSNAAYTPKYAQGFEILTDATGCNTMIVTKTPWQGADTTCATRLFISRDGAEAPAGFDGPVLRGRAKRIICMSSTHVAMLDALGHVADVVGVSGIDFIHNPAIHSRRDSIADVGYDSNIDYEAMLGQSPDLVLLYGVTGANTIEPKLKELGIPYMYVAEYLEQDPLGKAEWLVPIAEVLGIRDQGVAVFDRIPAKYNDLKQRLALIDTVPTVMINTPYREQWNMASTDSYLARLISDAGGNYVYNRNTSGQSLAIDMEEAYRLANAADVWINVGQATTLQQLKQTLPKFADVHPIATQQVWNTHPTYWESGIVHPELVLRDLAIIFHPGTYATDSLTYYYRLPER